MKNVKVCDLGRVVTGHTPPTTNRNYYGHQYLFIKPTDISIGHKHTYLTEENYSQLAFDTYKSSLIPAGSTCVVCIGTLGEKMTMTHCDCFTNQSINSIVPSKDYDADYVFYLLKNNLQTIKNLNKGTASGREFVSKSTFLEMPLNAFESIEVQKKIGQVLSAYDDLIENNRKQIKLLEEAAQRLYKEWFVDLHFPGWESTPVLDGLPEGWKKLAVADCLELYIGGGWGKESVTGKNTIQGRVIRGTDINDIKGGLYSNIPQRFHTENDIKSRVLKTNDIVFELSNGNINNIGRCLLIDDFVLKNCGDNTICASFCKLFRPLDKFHSLILYFEIQDMQVSGRMLPYKKQGSNGINNFAFEDFLTHEILLPSDKALIVPIANIISKICYIQNQLALLIQARDALLPKLMSGEIEV